MDGKHDLDSFLAGPYGELQELRAAARLRGFRCPVCLASSKDPGGAVEWELEGDVAVVVICAACQRRWAAASSSDRDQLVADLEAHLEQARPPHPGSP